MWVLNGWHNNYGGQSMQTEANDVIALATISEDKEEPKKQVRKKK